jgi:hypothetical protein
MSNSISTHSIVEAYSNIENIHSIERDRERTLGDSDFQLWCKQYRIGSRVESTNHRANELMAQYTNYTKWLSKI